MDPLTQALVSAGPGGLAAAIVFYFYRGKETSCKEDMIRKQAELDAANARIAALQDKIVSMMQAQLEAEPARRETLANITRSIQEQTTFLKAKLP